MADQIKIQAAVSCEWCGDIEVIESTDIDVIEARLTALHWGKRKSDGAWFCQAVCLLKDDAAIAKKGDCEI